MRTTFVRRRSVVLVLIAILAIPWPSAAGPRKPSYRDAKVAQPEPVPLQLLGRAWRLLQNVWTKEGCQIDPSGLCHQGSVQPQPTDQLDSGCQIDPGGLCHS